MAKSYDGKDIEATARDPSPDHAIGEVKNINKNQDAALEFLRSRADVRPMSEADEKALLRKIDWRIIPLMFGCYTLQYLDKTLINYANVMGLQEDANINPTQFSLLAMIFYVSYLGCEFPHAYGMQALPTAKYLGVMVIFWGLIVVVTCAAKNWAGLVTTRVLLGAFESAVAPSLMLITTMWYKRSEQPWRVGIWYIGVGVGTIVGSLMSFGFQHYHSDTFTSWQILFLVVGLITISTGGVVFVFLPDSPMRCKFLNHQEKVWTIERLRANQTGVENKTIKPAQILECFTDPQTWLLSLMMISSNVPNGAVSSYQATIISGFGYDSKTTALLQLPSGAVSIVSVLIATWLAGKFEQRGLNFVALLCPGILGGCLLAFLPDDNRVGLLIGNYLTNCIGATIPLVYSWVGANYAGHTKKTTMNATLLISFCIGNIIGPLTFTEKSAPDYIPAKITIVITCAVAVVLALLLRAYYMWENKRRDNMVHQGVLGHQEDIEFADVTDRMNKEFRYRL
ncbi:hypothetical protein Q7P37_004507 [Cladosporium fusiforme]